jgi:hypothetical protein
MVMIIIMMVMIMVKMVMMTIMMNGLPFPPLTLILHPLSKYIQI